MKAFSKHILLLFLLFSVTGLSCLKAANNKQQLRVLTYNIHHCNPPSRPGVIDVEAIARVINNQQPDLVALQEVDVLTNRSKKRNEIEELAEKTGLHYYFGKAIDYDGGEYGVGILSKFPINESRTIPLPNPYKGEPRVLAVSTVVLPDHTKICFAVTHLDVSHQENRDEQARAINKITEDIRLPIILAGDLNATPETNSLKILERHFVRSCSSCGHTIPVEKPTRTIDHILISVQSPLTPLSTEVISERYASDHLPVLALFEW